MNWQTHLTDPERQQLAEIDSQLAALRKQRNALANRARNRKFHEARRANR